MNIAEVRKDFVIYVIEGENSSRDLLYDTLSEAGYTVHCFSQAEDALCALGDTPPHIILCSNHLLGIGGLECIEEVRKLSSEIQFVLMTTFADSSTAMDALRAGAADYLYKPFEDISEVVFRTDRLAEKLHYGYENEQLLQELQEVRKNLKRSRRKVQKVREDQDQFHVGIDKLLRAKDTSEVVQNFLEHATVILGDAPILFFKHIPAYFSLSISNAVGFPTAQLRGMGLNLKEEIPNRYFELLNEPKKIPALDKMMSEVFKVSDYEAYPLEQEDGVAGIIVVLQRIEEASVRRLFEALLKLLKVSYSTATLKTHLHSIAVKDALTGLYNKKFFDQKAHEEVSRARRLELPVSLVQVGIDDFKTFSENNGPALGDVILKMVAALLKKTSRCTDVVARVGAAEFAVLLPHTDKVGASIKAEKIRRLIEVAKFPQRESQPNGRITVSIGVSEYPSLCHDAEGLVQSSDSAYFQIKGVMNRVSIAALPAEDFKPDFVVQLETRS